LLERGFAALECLQRSLAVRHLGRCHRCRVWQSLGYVTLDTRDLLARVIALQDRRVGILDALRVHNQERAAGVASLFYTGRANLIF